MFLRDDDLEESAHVVVRQSVERATTNSSTRRPKTARAAGPSSCCREGERLCYLSSVCSDAFTAFDVQSARSLTPKTCDDEASGLH